MMQWLGIWFGDDRKKKEEDERMLGTAQLTALKTSPFTQILVLFSLVPNTIPFPFQLQNNRRPLYFELKLFQKFRLLN